MIINWVIVGMNCSCRRQCRSKKWPSLVLDAKVLSKTKKKRCVCATFILHVCYSHSACMLHFWLCFAVHVGLAQVPARGQSQCLLHYRRKLGGDLIAFFPEIFSRFLLLNGVSKSSLQASGVIFRLRKLLWSVFIVFSKWKCKVARSNFIVFIRTKGKERVTRKTNWKASRVALRFCSQISSAFVSIPMNSFAKTCSKTS